MIEIATVPSRTDYEQETRVQEFFDALVAAYADLPRRCTIHC